MNKQLGIISGQMLAIIGLGTLTLGLGAFSIWAFVNYTESNNNVQGKIDVAVAQAEREEAEKQQKIFSERAKFPLLTFKAPNDYCGVTFDYPRTWSVYVDEDGKDGGDYEAYLHPVQIPPIDPDTQFAIRLTIQNKKYDSVMESYQGLITSGKLDRNSHTSKGKDGSRLIGNFSAKIRGDAVVYGCRAQTITVRTDSDKMQDEYNKLIQTINFNK